MVRLGGHVVGPTITVTIDCHDLHGVAVNRIRAPQQATLRKVDGLSLAQYPQESVGLRLVSYQAVDLPAGRAVRGPNRSDDLDLVHESFDAVGGRALDEIRCERDVRRSSLPFL